MLNIQKCIEFKKLQWDINSDIDQIGYTTIAKADLLDEMVDNLTTEEMDYILEWKDRD
jgi:hypothetical protein